MQPDLETVSLGHWLELPGYPFNQWKIDQEHNQSCNLDGVVAKSNGKKRVLLGEVAQYYSDYVVRMGLEGNFMNGVEVVCAANIRRAKLNEPALESHSTSSSASSSLSSSPSLHSLSHSMATAHLLHADVCNQHTEADDLFQDDSETSAGGLEQSAEQVKISSDTALTRGSGIYESDQEVDSFTYSPQPFATDPSQTEFLCENCCCTCISDPDDSGVYCNEAKRVKRDHRWCIKGRRKSQQSGRVEDIIILAKKVVLACGVGQQRKLGVLGEHHPFIHHRYTDLLPAIEASQCDPILIVGAGLTAADAVLLSLERGVRVIHAFYQDASDPSLIFNKMPPDLYKEYRHVFALMQGKVTNQDYVPLPKHKVVEFKKGGVCRLKNVDEIIDLNVSLCFVLIGCEADLRFLPQWLVSKLGIQADNPTIHPKTNPIDIDPYSFQSESIPSLYAMGPLVGDNFVRFVLGGALGIACHLTSTRVS